MTNKLQVLLVDDDDIFCGILQEALNLDTELADRVVFHRLRDGQDCLDYLAGVAPYQDRKAYPWPNIVLLDERMPRMDGTEALRKIRQAEGSRFLPICMLSSSNQERLVRHAYALGANLYLVKPDAFEELQERVSRVFRFLDEVVELPLAPDAKAQAA